MKLPRIELKHWIAFWVFAALAILFVGNIFINLAYPSKTVPVSTNTNETPAEVIIPTNQQTTNTTGIIRYPYDELRRFSDNELLDGNWNGVEIEVATNTFHYADATNGFSLEIPYSANWKTKGYGLDPIERISDEEFVYGPLRVVPFEGCCAIERDFSLNLAQGRSVKQIRAEEASVSNLTVETINTFTVVKKLYICPPGERSMGDSSADCFFESAPRYEVLLPNVNLIFSASPFAQNGDMLMRKVIQSLKIKPRETLTEEQYKSNPYCGWTGPDTEMPDIRISYIDTSTRVSITLPYNDSWGGARCGLVPYEDHFYENGIHNVTFGPFVGGEGGVGRGAWATFEESTSSAALLSTLRNRSGDNANPERSANVTILNVNGMTVYRYDELDSLGGGQEWHVANPFVHLVLHSVFGALHENEAVKIIQSLRVER